MRKHLLLIIALCLHIAARGQTLPDALDLSWLPQPTQAKAMRYWIDDDIGSMQTTDILNGQYMVDVSSLIGGLHTIHFQIIDSEEKVLVPYSGIFLKMESHLSVSEAGMLRYWFDDDTNISTCNANVGIQLLDVSSLLDGLHTLHYQVVDTEGYASYIASNVFLKMEMMDETGEVKVEKFIYWFDDEETQTTIDMPSGIMTLDASSLLDGLHTIHCLVVCNDGSVTSAYSSVFLRMNFDVLSTTAQSLRYWFDEEDVVTTTEIAQGIQMLDASQLLDGLHMVHYQIVDNSGTVTPTYSSIFLKMAEIDETATTAQNLRYWFDDEKEVKTTSVASGTQIIDVTNLQTGLHTLHYQLVDNNGGVTSTTSRIFIKNFDKPQAEGENRITKYQYWLNANMQTMQTVELASAANPYTLISLLPMQQEPIYSDCFHFEVTNNVPTLYAKNIFHVRFYDAQNICSGGQKPFVDYSVKQEVTNLTLLEPGVRVTTAKPETNTIKWYKVTAERGDGLTFKADYPCTIQLFSPTGEELYAVSGTNSIKYGGSYAPEDGTYYLAIHDVTAQNCNMLSVDYQHIDKYVVLEYTPRTIGVAAGYIYVRLKGNGFDKLKDVYLTNGTVEISVSKIIVDSKSSVELQFTLFGEESVGDYDLVLNFKDEEEMKTLIIDHAIKFNTADFGDITIKVEPSRRIGFPYPVIVKVRNTGNVSKLFVPFNIGVSFNLSGQMPTESSWTSMYTMNFDVLFNSDDDITNSYSPYTITDNIIDTGLPGVVLHGFIPEIGPYETKEYILGFVGGAHKKFNLYAWTGKPLNMDSDVSTFETNIYSVWDYLAEIEKIKDNSESRAGMRRAPDLDRVNNTLDVADQINANAGRAARLSVGIGLSIGGIESGLRLRNIHAYTDGDDFAKDVLSDYEGSVRNSMPTPRQIGDTSGMPEWLQHLLGLQGDQSHCGTPTCGASPIDIYAPGDPNDIYGYTAESGSKYMKEGTSDVYYTIEFENNPEIANASAHTIVVKDTLDANRFDLSSFAATSVKLGDKVMELDGKKNFSKQTLDLRPEINVIAQVSLSFDESKGIATWTIESLDPMSMEPTLDVMQGVLPVNVNGNGQGELTFDIKLKPGMVEGETVSNRAGIVFDQEGTIMTPSWVNTVDATLPESCVSNVTMASDTTVAVRIEASDVLSKPWKYDLYVQENANGTWKRKAVNIPVDSMAQMKVNEGISYGFYVVVTDSAGNVEQKEAAREFTFEMFGSQIETNTQIELVQGWNWISHNQQDPLPVDALKPASARMVGQTEELIEDTHFGWMGDLEKLLPTEMYKVQMDQPLNIPLSGLLFNAAFRSIPLYRGWNWIGYPVANTMTPTEALEKLEAEEGDMLIGQDGLTTFSEGQWVGTLLEMMPGLGYMYRSQSDKNLFYNATAQASSRRVQPSTFNVQSSLPEDWTVDKRKYPNVMGVIASLMQDQTAVNTSEWIIGAFSGGECRGLSTNVGVVLMMNVYGQGGEPIVFYAMNLETGEVQPVVESEQFQANVLGTMLQPYMMHISEPTGISGNVREILSEDGSIYDLQGRKIDGTQMKKGIYVTTDKNRAKTQKVIRR